VRPKPISKEQCESLIWRPNEPDVKIDGLSLISATDPEAF